MKGFIFSCELSGTHLRLKLFRFITIARIPVSDIRYMRLAGFSEFITNFTSSIYWPAGLMPQRAANPLYVLESARSGRLYFLRMTSGFHYRVRMAIPRINRMCGRRRSGA